jgi:hypothetical protein
MKARIALVGLLVGLVSIGCRPRGVESFISATTPVKTADKYEGDQYANGGIADASGGTKTEAQYGKGAKSGADAQPNYGYDQPAKGSGQQPGENPGTGVGNGPALQGNPGDYSSTKGQAKI